MFNLTAVGANVGIGACPPDGKALPMNDWESSAVNLIASG